MDGPDKIIENGSHPFRFSNNNSSGDKIVECTPFFVSQQNDELTLF
jgi:hypothetical protein